MVGAGVWRGRVGGWHVGCCEVEDVEDVLEAEEVEERDEVNESGREKGEGVERS